MKRVKRKGTFSVSCEKIGIEDKWFYLKVRYGKNYIGQIQLREPIKVIPDIIKILQKTLKDEKVLSKLNKRK